MRRGRQIILTLNRGDAMDMRKLERLCTLLDGMGLLAEICGDDGTIEPTRAALNWAELNYASKPAAEKYRLARAETLIAFARKHQVI